MGRCAEQSEAHLSRLMRFAPLHIAGCLNPDDCCSVYTTIVGRSSTQADISFFAAIQRVLKQRLFSP
jgi:hypothetical protein